MLFTGKDEPPQICPSCGKPEEQIEVGPLHTKVWKCTNKKCCWGQGFPKIPKDKISLGLAYEGIVYFKDITDKKMLKDLSDILYRCEDFGYSPSDVLDMLMTELKIVINENGRGNMKAKKNLLKDIAKSEELMLKELAAIKKNPKRAHSKKAKASNVAFDIKGDTLKVVGFKQK